VAVIHAGQAGIALTIAVIDVSVNDGNDTDVFPNGRIITVCCGDAVTEGLSTSVIATATIVDSVGRGGTKLSQVVSSGDSSNQIVAAVVPVTTPSRTANTDTFANAVQLLD
jgi:hypothetical protein